MIRRIAFTILFLAAALSAQRYSGHDHAVFHRSAQPPSPPVKHQVAPPANSTGSHAKNTASASAAAQQAKPDAEFSHNTTPPKAEPPLDGIPRL
jgi:hypothetical protein